MTFGAISGPTLKPSAHTGVSLTHALIYVWAGYYGSQRTRFIGTGIFTATATSVIGFMAFFFVPVISTPDLVGVPFSKPFTVAILSVSLLLALGYSVVLGIIGGIIGKWTAPIDPQEIPLS